MTTPKSDKQYDRILCFIGDVGCLRCVQFKPLWEKLISEDFVKDNFLTLQFIGRGNIKPYANEKVLYQTKNPITKKYVDKVNEDHFNKLTYGDKYEEMKKLGKLPIRERIKEERIPRAFFAPGDEVGIPCILIVSTVEYSKRWDIETGMAKDDYKKKITNIKQFRGKLRKDLTTIDPELISWIKENIDSPFAPV